jgi:hypothetical protein
MSLSLQQIEQLFTVDTIMTPRENFIELSKDANHDKIIEHAKSLKVDTLPIVENGEITDVFSSGTIYPLTPKWLISRDTTIRKALQLLTLSGKPSLFVFYQQRIIGIVTPADFNRLAARTYFYNLLADLEMRLSEHIRAYFTQNGQGIEKYLTEQKLQDAKAELQKADLEIDIVHLLYLSDIAKIINGEKKLQQNLQLKSAFVKGLGGLTELRNAVMHSTKFILDDKKGIQKLHERVERLADLLTHLEQTSKIEG